MANPNPYDFIVLPEWFKMPLYMEEIGAPKKLKANPFLEIVLVVYFPAQSIFKLSHEFSSFSARFC